MQKFKWITNGTDDFLQYVLGSGRNRFLPVRSEREILIVLSTMALGGTPDGIPDDAKEMDMDLKDFAVLLDLDHGGFYSDTEKICERVLDIFGYDLITEWNLGKARPPAPMMS